MTTKEMTLPVEVEKQIEPCIAEAKAFKIQTSEDLERVAQFSQKVLALSDEIDETLGARVKDAHKMHKALKETVDTLQSPLKKAAAIAKEKITKYAEDNDDLPKIKGLSISTKSVIEVPDLNDEQFIELMKLAAKGKIPAGLFHLDAKVFNELHNIGMFRTLGDISPKITEVKTVTIRRK